MMQPGNPVGVYDQEVTRCAARDVSEGWKTKEK